jgi:hypothetical protein
MNIWEELADLDRHYIADNRLRAAWERMVHTSQPCRLPVGAGNRG